MSDNYRNNHDDCDSYSNGGSVYRALRERIAGLDFSSFRKLVLLWLGAKGYRHMRFLDRKSPRGRRRIGGADFVALLPNSENVWVAVAVRFWRTPVQQRVVDELWGFMLRHGIATGMIVTNGEFSPKALTAASEFSGRPIRLVSGARLAGSMAALGLGVDGARPDARFFDNLGAFELGARHPRSAAGEAATPSPNPDGDLPGWFVVGALVLLVGLFWMLMLRGRP